MRVATHRLLSVSALLIGFFLLTGCTSLVDQDQTLVSPEMRIPLAPSSAVGQTFVARHGGLAGIEFWLDAEPGTQGQLKLHLRSDPLSAEDLAVASISIAETISTPGYYRFSFPADTHSHGAYRYAYLTLEGNGTVWIGAASGDAYIDGSAYRNHEPVDAQLSFRLVYHFPELLLELRDALSEWISLLVLTILLYVIPGYGLLSFIFPENPTSPNHHTTNSLWKTAWPARLAIAAGISLALYPLLLLWSQALGVRSQILYVWGPAILGLFLTAWRHRHWQLRETWQGLLSWLHSPTFWPDFTLVMILFFIFAARLLVIRTLDAPLWGDSYQHAVISQLILDHEGLFESWEPYTPYRGLTVHFGFSAATAALASAMSIDATYATLLSGQLINAISVLTLYPLALRFAHGNRWAGVGAVLVAGLLSPMPAYYVNWGRFAQMSGQAILPVALWWLWEAAEKNPAKRASLLAALTFSGMTLHYYRMPLYYATFVLAWMPSWAASTTRLSAKQWMQLVPVVSLFISGSLVFLAPLAYRLAGSILAAKLEAGLVSESARSLDKIIEDYRIWLDVTHFVPTPLLIASVVALLLSIQQKQWLVASCGLWVGALSLLVAARLIQLPGANLMQNFAVLIALYIPVSLSVGWLLSETVQTLNRFVAPIFLRNSIQQVAALTTCIVGALGLHSQLLIVDQRHILVTRPDIHAMEWIQRHIPNNARFLVEGFRIYAGRSAVGSDAGWWIPLLARRENTMPPQYALLNETPIRPNYSEQIVSLIAHLETNSPNLPESLRQLCDLGVTHVYIGQRQGQVGAGAFQLFTPKDFLSSPDFKIIYHRDRVWIFELKPTACKQTR